MEFSLIIGIFIFIVSFFILYKILK